MNWRVKYYTNNRPVRGAITQVLLSIATANLNARVRNRGMSARELWTQRDQFTNEQLPLNDYRIIREQHELRNANHEQSRQSKSPRGRGSVHAQQHIDTGDIVYLYSDKSKLRSRCRYLVVSTEGDWLNISKFTGTQLRATSYRVKRTECYKVLSETGHDLPVSYELLLLLCVWNTLTVSMTVSTTIPLHQDPLVVDVASLQGMQ